MAKEYEVKCPYCKYVRKIMLTGFTGQIVNTNGVRSAEEKELSRQPSLESLNEENWIDLQNPCPRCGRKFSFNIVTEESRE